MDANLLGEQQEAADFAALRERIRALAGVAAAVPPRIEADAQAEREAVALQAQVDAENDWREQVPAFREAARQYFAAMSKLGVAPDPAIAALANEGGFRAALTAILDYLTNPVNLALVESAIRKVAGDPKFLACYSTDDFESLFAGMASRRTHAQVFLLLRRRFFAAVARKVVERLTGQGTLAKPFDLMAVQRTFTDVLREAALRGYGALAPAA
ncbi:MAG: hypothetical protein SF069_17690 [Phycisphaerae bacterium]|nr:hypothetical protein [Phycisphaerae bacterium]